MSEKAFIKKLKGKDSAKSLVEVQNDILVNVGAGLPNSTKIEQNIIDSKNSSIISAKNAQNWVVVDNNLVLSSNDAYISESDKTGIGLWIDSIYTFPTSTNPDNPVVAIINPSAKWVLRLCGKNLLSSNENINFTFVVKIGSTNISNIDVSIERQAGFFCKEFIIDFSDSQATIIKANGGENLTVQLICNDNSAYATIFNGKTILTVLQRRVDSDVVASDTMTWQDIEDKFVEIDAEIVEIHEELDTKANDDEVVHILGDETVIGNKNFIGGIGADNIQFDTTPVVTDPIEGQLVWDADAGTLQIGLPGGTTKLQIGQEMNVRAKNVQGAPIGDGSVVYIYGASGQRPTIKLADNASIMTSQTTIGLATENIANNQFGYVTVFGLVRDINTSALTEGALVWLGTNGAMTSTKPTAPNISVALGICIYQHATQGIVACDTTLVPRLQALSDVYVNSIQNKDILLWNSATSRFENSNLLNNVVTQTATPTGYPNRTDSTLSYNSGTRTISIAPTSTSFNYYIKGIKYTQNTAITAVNPATTGNYFFYIDSNNTPQFSTTPWTITNADVLTGFVYYSALKGAGVALEERHGTQRNLPAHLEMHEKIGTYWVSGLAIGNYTVQPVIPANSDNQFSLTSGVIADEDIRATISALTSGVSYKVWYRSTGGEWVWTDNTVPFIYTPSGYINYNNVSTNTNVELTTNNYVCYYVFAIPAVDTGYQIVTIAGQNVYTTLEAAQAETVQSLSWGNIPFSEFCPLNKIIFRTNAAYGTLGKCRIAYVEDLRTLTSRGSQASAATSHQSLSNLQLAAAGVTYGHINDQAQTIAGIKTFSDSPIVPTPTTDYQAATKKYVTDTVAATPTLMRTCSTALYSATLTGTVTVTDTSTTITGSSTLFTTELAAGDTIVIGGTPLKVQSIASNTSLTTTKAFAGVTASGQTAYKATNAKTIDLSGITVTAGLRIIVNFTNGNYGYTPTLNGDLIYGAGGNAVGETMPAFFPAGCDIPIYRNSANTGWVYEKVLVKSVSPSNQSTYNLYSNGYCEQMSTLTADSVSVSFLINMINTAYWWMANVKSAANFFNFDTNLNRTGFTGCVDIFGTSAAHGNHAYWVAGIKWEVKGYAQI